MRPAIFGALALFARRRARARRRSGVSGQFAHRPRAAAGFHAEHQVRRLREPAGERRDPVAAELPAEAYPEVEKSFTDEALKSRGMTVRRASR